ncbi:molybdopterin-binding protein [Heliomarina baculiformis]|uniref:molybdopterin-binding protein n=1 Tax=Heliomarina baculiformis TaxID=2872036 RepID=UPI001EE20333|nr:molybdopterin-binding protein [Heliomarina baculiformis]
MKFGVIPTEKAQGHVLAHSVQLAGGRLRKGKLLAKQDLAALLAEGWYEITVAQLEPGDIGEDASALRLAHALVPDPAGAGVHLSEPFTGRVNLLANHPGVAVIDAARVNAVNAVQPMITLATVPRWQRMDAGGMVATVKIISYAVPESHLQAACAEALGAVHIAPVALKTAVLIETLVSRDAGDKGWRMMHARMERMGVTLSLRRTVPHATEALAAAIAETTEDLVLILTGSATSDPHDIAPEALRAAGGTMIRFGMPVDPGNLLFLGHLGADRRKRPVIGLPGSARSPALSGIDWVIERTLCGLEVTSAGIAEMGVGGLLKEIPTRPQPRSGKTQG